MPRPICGDCNLEDFECICDDFPYGRTDIEGMDQETYDAYMHAVEKEEGK